MPLRLRRVDLVVAPDDDLRPELLEEVDEVVGEAVVVVDQQDHCLGEGNRGLERRELAQALLVLGPRVGVGDDARARL